MEMCVFLENLQAKLRKYKRMERHRAREYYHKIY